MPKPTPKPSFFGRKWVRSTIAAIVIFGAGVAMGGTWSPDQHGCGPASTGEVSRG
ncbi:hypothetical protein [Gordonia sp. 852002-51296_SCH5728562-b]|uniref:hypothetical protein n=1 Tax=Gordonia sp. 852002-51296_SCH5728562-b TaxID=1834101 RepID=UPI000A5EC273|nr:hypothetical protein [Gordonia sp. 852002-51296_SCH5728562-b]